MKISEDSKCAIKLGLNPICTNWTKYIDVRHYLLRETVEEGKVESVHVSTLEKVVDSLTRF